MTRNVLKLDAAEYKAALSELNLYFEAPERLFYLPNRLLRLLRSFVDVPAKLCRIEHLTAEGAFSTVSLKPSDGLANLLAALRASH